MGTRDTERHRRRAENLRQYADRYEAARSALQRVYDEGERLRSQFVIRRCLVLRRPGTGSPGQRMPSPIANLLTQKGWALHLYLIALFDAQSRRRPGAAISNTRPLRSDGQQTGWVDFLPATTATADRAAGMMRQTTRALTLLAQNDLVRLGQRAGVRGRFERFQLLHESGDPHRSWSLARYEIPAPDAVMEQDFRSPAAKAGTVEALQVPAAFFLKGWVHVLSAAEIATLLMVRELETRYPQRSKAGVFANEPTRMDWYGLSRDVYECHRQLTRYGLIERLEDPNRGPDGKIVRQPAGTKYLEALRFRMVWSGFDQPALKAVSDVLRQG